MPGIVPPSAIPRNARAMHSPAKDCTNAVQREIIPKAKIKNGTIGIFSVVVKYDKCNKLTVKFRANMF